MAVAFAYEADTHVIDVDDLDMQVMIAEGGDVWHRKMVGGLVTACDRPIDYRLQLGQRIESYRGKLCPECFTAHELARGAVESERDRDA